MVLDIRAGNYGSVQIMYQLYWYKNHIAIADHSQTNVYTSRVTREANLVLLI